MHVPWSFYVPPVTRGASVSATRYEPQTPSDQAASQAQRWEVLLRLRELFVRRPAAGLQLLDEAVRRGGPEAGLVLAAAREAAQSSQDARLLRGLIERLVRLKRTREAFELARRLLRCPDAARDDLIRAARLATRCGLRDQARAYLIQAGVSGLIAGLPEAGGPAVSDPDDRRTAQTGEERSDELGP